MEEEGKPKLLETKLAALESQLDMMETELSYLNQILLDCGFPKGLATLRETVEELLHENSHADPSKD
jgi:hypothetical protein